MRVQLQPAFILHQRPFTETSLLLEAFTVAHGRIALLARAARGARSRLRGILRPFTPLLLSWSGKTEMMSLTAAEPNGMSFGLTGTALFSGFYLNELLLRLLPRFDPHAELFKFYQQTLQYLHTPEPALEVILRGFEKSLLTELGYGLVLNRDNQQAPVLENETYQFVMGKGLVKNAQAVFLGQQLLAFHHDRLQSSEDFFTAKAITRLALTELLGAKPLKSKDLFK